MDIERTTLSATTLLVVRERVETAQLAAFYDRAYGQVGAALGAAGLAPAGPAYGWYASMPTDVVEVAAGFPVHEVPAELPEGVEVLQIPAGEAVVGTYLGSYDGLGDAWSKVVAWCREQGVRDRGDFWEVYVTEPTPDGDPAANVTRLVLPLR